MIRELSWIIVNCSFYKNYFMGKWTEMNRSEMVWFLMRNYEIVKLGLNCVQIRYFWWGIWRKLLRFFLTLIDVNWREFGRELAWILFTLIAVNWAVNCHEWFFDVNWREFGRQLSWIFFFPTWIVVWVSLLAWFLYFPQK